MKLVSKETGKELKVGDAVKTFRGEACTIAGFYSRPAPSTGRVQLKFPAGFTSEYYPGVIDATIVEDEA